MPKKEAPKPEPKVVVKEIHVYHHWYPYHSVLPYTYPYYTHTYESNTTSGTGCITYNGWAS